MQNCQGVLSSRTFNEDVKQDFHGGCQAGISIKTFTLDWQAQLWSWTVKQGLEVGLSRRTMRQDCKRELWSRTEKQNWEAELWGRTAKENCEAELSSSTGKPDNDAGLSDRAVKGSWRPSLIVIYWIKLLYKVMILFEIFLIPSQGTHRSIWQSCKSVVSRWTSYAQVWWIQVHSTLVYLYLLFPRCSIELMFCGIVCSLYKSL